MPEPRTATRTTRIAAAEQEYAQTNGFGYNTLEVRLPRKLSLWAKSSAALSSPSTASENAATIGTPRSSECVPRDQSSDAQGGRTLER